ncbi:MAG: uncharacterized protein QOD89_1742 [Bradyrhizobium sp.]|nr:uncharacterized protein [Bradyrhizobium sp.]
MVADILSRSLGRNEITALYTYPVKSLRGVAVSEIEVGPYGFKWDREWAVIGPDGRRLSARKYPRLATIGVGIAKDALVLSHAEQRDITVEHRGSEKRPVKLTATLVDQFAQSASSEVDAWMSEIMGFDCQLVRMSQQGSQELALFPVHLVSLQSLAEVNRRLSKPISELRFRPNIVVQGVVPFEEDRWANLSIERVHMRVVDLTDRCSVPNIDPESGETSIEPLKTLAGFRRNGTGVTFGLYARPTAAGFLQVGMEVVPFVTASETMIQPMPRMPTI